jgi:ABC-type amino acid transport substrate-binding protein
MARFQKIIHDHDLIYYGRSSMNSTKTIIWCTVLAAIVSLAINFGFRDHVLLEKKTSNEWDLYSLIQNSGTIRAAYFVGAPLLSIDPNSGKKSGIFYDVVNALAERLHFKVNWIEEVGYGEMIQGLNDRRYDIVGSGVWINSDRARGADFTVPVYYDAVFAYAKLGDTRFQEGLQKLNSPDFTISTMDGELGASIADNDFPKAKKLGIPQNADFTQMILNVISRKADIVFLAFGPARAYQAANPNQIVSVNPDRPLRIFPNAIMLPQGQYKLRQVLSYTLMEMINSGEIDAILSRYERVPNSFLRVAVPFGR